mmetsp:Transcript_30500/g.62074  ORF Transcript_30500/g.62074 Transcript_30500/m.62074 type:complete len:237 (+) Transcript_30500:292-1002(+)
MFIRNLIAMVFPFIPYTTKLQHCGFKLTRMFSAVTSGSDLKRIVNMAKITVLVDMDGVIADFDTRALEILQQRLPSWDIMPRSEISRFPLAANFKKSSHKAKIRSMFLEEGFFASLPPIPGAINALKEMHAHPSLDVFICSAPIATSTFCASEKMGWVKEHLGQEWVRRTILTSDKSLVRGDILIDDAPEAKAAAMPPSWEHVYFTQPYNKELQGKRRILCWDQWRHVILNTSEHS